MEKIIKFGKVISEPGFVSRLKIAVEIVPCVRMTKGMSSPMYRSVAAVWNI